MRHHSSETEEEIAQMNEEMEVDRQKQLQQQLQMQQMGLVDDEEK